MLASRQLGAASSCAPRPRGLRRFFCVPFSWLVHHWISFFGADASADVGTGVGAGAGAGAGAALGIGVMMLLSCCIDIGADVAGVVAVIAGVVAVGAVVAVGTEEEYAV